MADNEDVPPLEDMSDLLQQVEKLREKRSTETKHKASVNGDIQRDPPVKAALPASHSLPATESGDSSTNYTNGHVNHTEPSGNRPNIESEGVKSKSDFGGLKKGFLFGGSAKKTQKTKPSEQSEQKTDKKSNKTLEEIPFLKKEESTKEKYQFQEVQDAMKDSPLLQNKDWVTDDLLTKIQNSETVAKRLADPSFVQAIGEFQSNPQAAMVKYQNNPDIQNFFKEFCGLMGEHFTKLADHQDKNSSNNQPKVAEIGTHLPTGGADISVQSSTNPNQMTADDERRMQQILADPSIREILMDSKVQNLIQVLRNNPAEGQRLLATGDNEFRSKVQKLVGAGLLQFQ